MEIDKQTCSLGIIGAMSVSRFRYEGGGLGGGGGEIEPQITFLISILGLVNILERFL